MDKVAVWNSSIRGFGVYKVIETDIIFNMVTAKTHKYIQDTIFVMKRQKEAAESIIKILEASVSAKSDTSK